MRLITMTVVVVLLLLLVNVEFSFSCDAEGRVLICRNVPAHFSSGYLTLAMYVSDVGEINSTVFQSDNLTSVTRLRMDNAGITAVAEGAFGSFLNLTSISLTRNMLTHVTWRWFGRPDVLTELSLTENHIRALNESQLSRLVNLTELRLNKNRITTLGPNSFLSQVDLTELDLSENRMTRLSPQLLWSLRSTRVRLDRNPWDCSCGAEDFVVLLKDLQSRSQLDRHMEVTCQTPPALRGQPVWNVTVCMTSPEPGSTLESQSVHTKPTDGPISSKPTDRPISSKPTDGPISSAKPVTTASQSTSETETSVQTKSTDASALKTSHSATHVTSPSSETSVASHSGGTEKCATSEPSSNTSTVCSLIFVIAVLCVPLCVLCFLAVQHRRKRCNKAVTPDRPKEERNELEAERRSSHDRSAGRSENTDPEEAWRRPCTGVRAKSANAILFIAPFGVCGKNQVTAQNDSEAQSQDAKKKLENEAEATRGNQAENINEKNEKQSDDGNKMDENSQCVSIGADALPYLSISTNQNQTSPENLNQRSTDRSGQRSQMGKVMGRVSTWPPTAAQWQERCQMKEEGNETEMFSGEVKKTGNKVEHPSISDKKEEEMEQNEMKDLRTQVLTDIKQEDPASARRTSHKTLNQDPKSAGNPAHMASSKSEQRNEPKQAAGAENRSTGSKAPSGGASPDDETLLYGNEYAFMDLLHEVAQNHGRWTRERWRQIHVNKQRR